MIRHVIILSLLSCFVRGEPVTESVLLGSPVVLWIDAAGSPAPTYELIKDGTKIAEGSSYTIQSASSVDGGNYTAVATNTEGSAVSDTFTLIIETPPPPPPPTGEPVFTLHPWSQEVASSVNATFTIAVTGEEPIYLQWFHNDEAIVGADKTAFIAGPEFIGNDYFKVIATNLVGSATSNTAALWRTAAPTPPPVIDPPPPPPPEEPPPPPAGIAPTITTGPQSQTVAKFTSVRFYVVAEGTEPLVYQWFYNGVSIPGATGPEHRINRVTPGMRGAYEVVVENAFGSKISRATLTVRN
jgi:hypothetical protein